MRWAIRGQIRGGEQGNRLEIADRVNGLEAGEAPPHVGGLTRGCQGGTQIVLSGGVDLIAGKRVEILGQKDSSHVAKPRLDHATAGRVVRKAAAAHVIQRRSRIPTASSMTRE